VFYAATGGSHWRFCSDLPSDPCGCSTYDRFPVCDGESTTVKQLYMWNNNLTGTIPDEVGAWTDLKSTQLSGNLQLSGTLPTSLSRWKKLQEFYAFDNHLSGTLPSIDAWSQLNTLDVFGNQLSGSLPSGLSALTQLRVFNVDRNRLTGSLPALPFATLRQCDLLNHAKQGANVFDCPWPNGTVGACRKYDGSTWVPITGSDCGHGGSAFRSREQLFFAYD
jgi:hypothetical protein